MPGKILVLLLYAITPGSALTTNLWAADKPPVSGDTRARQLPVKVTKESASQAILAAIEGYKEVNRLGFAWSTTYTDYIGPAKAAWRKGNYRKAQELANKALEQIKSGREQQKNSINSNVRK